MHLSVCVCESVSPFFFFGEEGSGGWCQGRFWVGAGVGGKEIRRQKDCSQHTADQTA